MRRLRKYLAGIMILQWAWGLAPSERARGQGVDSVGCYEHLVFDVFVVDTLAYLTSGPAGLFMIMNVSDPSQPTLVGQHLWTGNT